VAMIREIVKSAGHTYKLNLPDEMLGKTVEIIAYEVGPLPQANIVDPNEKLQDIKKKYAQYPLISHSDYEFNRDEANDYE